MVDDNSSSKDKIERYLKLYRKIHNDEDTINHVKSLLNKDDIELPASIKNIDKDEISKQVGNIIIEEIKKRKNNNDEIIDLLSIVVKNNLVKRKQKTINLKINKRLLKQVSIIGTALVISCGAYNLSKSSKDNDKQNQIEVNIEDNQKIETKYKKEQKDNNKKLTEKQEKEIEEAKKQLVLYNFNDYKTVDDILKRQQELENLGLTDDDKLYKECKLSAPLQWFIYEQATVNGFPMDLILSTIHTETRGYYNSSGEESYNAWNNSYDLGLTQQNTASSLVNFCNHYNINYNDDTEYNKIYKLMRDNDYVNVVGCIISYNEIAARIKSYDPKEYAGCYNGWLLWRKKKISRQYVEIFEDAYYGNYTEYHTNPTEEEIENKINQQKKILKKSKNN